MNLDEQLRNWIEEEFETKMEDRLIDRLEGFLKARTRVIEQNIVKELKQHVREYVDVAIPDAKRDRESDRFRESVSVWVPYAGSGGRSGDIWSKKEEYHLIKAIKEFINLQASFHERSYVAIKERLAKLYHSKDF